ncbi:MAG: cupin domain-containing protein [bacterium]|nr:cupin domain-containing protein [bacterium]
MDNRDRLKPTPLVIVPPAESERYVPILRRDQTVAMKSGMVTLPPGQSVGEHSTENHEEQLVILEGAGSVTVEGMGCRKIRVGQFAYIPPHTRHNVTADPESPLRYVFTVCQVEGLPASPMAC